MTTCYYLLFANVSQAAAPTEIEALGARVLEMKGQVAGVRDAHFGPNVSDHDRSHAFAGIVEFEDRPALQAFLSADERLALQAAAADDAAQLVEGGVEAPHLLMPGADPGYFHIAMVSFARQPGAKTRDDMNESLDYARTHAPSGLIVYEVGPDLVGTSGFSDVHVAGYESKGASDRFRDTPLRDEIRRLFFAHVGERVMADVSR